MMHVQSIMYKKYANYYALGYTEDVITPTLKTLLGQKHEKEPKIRRNAHFRLASSSNRLWDNGLLCLGWYEKSSRKIINTKKFVNPVHQEWLRPGSLKTRSVSLYEIGLQLQNEPYLYLGTWQWDMLPQYFQALRDVQLMSI